MGVPSTFSPVVVTLIPPSDASRTVVKLLTVLGPLLLSLVHVTLPCPERIVGPKQSDSGDRYTNKQLCADVFHSFLSFFDIG
jgi:hypothetical protein